MVSIINYEFIVLILCLFLDIIFIIKPKVGLLNLVFGLVTILFTVFMIPELPFSVNFRTYFVVMMVIISLITMSMGINTYSKNRKIKR